MHEYDKARQENEHEEVDSDSIHCLSLVSISDVRRKKFPKDDRSYSYRAAIRYFVSESQGKVTCEIGLCDNFLGLCVFFSLHIGLLVPLYIFKSKLIQRKLYV